MGRTPSPLSGLVGGACEPPIVLGPRKGQPAQGTGTGYARHKNAGEQPCDLCILGMRQESIERYIPHPRDNWCYRWLHKLEGDNLMLVEDKSRGVTYRRCRACFNEASKTRLRKSEECPICEERFLTEAAYDAHFLYPLDKLGRRKRNEPPERCLTAVEMRARGMVRAPGRLRPWKLGPKTHCKNGHRFTPANTYIEPNRPTVRICRECSRERGRQYWSRKVARQEI